MRRAGVGEELFYYSSYFCNRSFPPQSSKPLALHIYIGRIIVDLSNPQIFVERTSLPIFRYFLSLFPVSGPQQTSHNTVKIPPLPPSLLLPPVVFPVPQQMTTEANYISVTTRLPTKNGY